MTPKQHWWQRTTIYQIYPRSFADSNDDGIGDLRGIISKLDYIQDLGFETIWVSPFFRSPQQDWGYDVSDYYSVAPEYGNSADVDGLIEAVHQRGMRILFDLVMNHTSIQYPWFQESRSSRDNPKRDWYIWKDGDGKRPPNNWKAIPGGSGWHYDAGTEQWYYASFLPFQPDLNFRNPDVKEAMFDVVRYWLDKGVDGFRLDIFHSIYKDAQFRNNPFALAYPPTEDLTAGFFQKWEYSLNQPETFELARELRAIANAYSPERVLLGEIFGDDDTVRRYLGEQQDGLNLVFLWKLLKLRPDACFFRDVICHYETRYPAPYTPVYVFGNHDQKRVISKIGNNARQAKLLALFQFTIRGVPVTYYGEEIGLAEERFSAKTAKDPMGRQYAWVPGFLLDLLDLYVNRDGCRTPMQWNDGPNAGFCGQDATPWLPVHENYKTINVKSELADEHSLLNTYKQLLHLRRDSGALREGKIQLIDGPDMGKNLLAYRREFDGEEILVAINFGKTPGTFQNPTACQRVLLPIGLDEPVTLESVRLPPYSGVILGK
ncbi:MAG: alpha-glucosidase [Anaerolineae bacterium]|nr:alpha-glucosidase [Anaerolineae bacterium]